MALQITSFEWLLWGCDFKGLTIVHMLAVPDLCHFNWRFNNSYQREKRSEWPFNNREFLGILPLLLLDLYEVARRILTQLGITEIYGSHFCRFSDRERFFSCRRDGVTGRMANVIWLESPTHRSLSNST